MRPVGPRWVNILVILAICFSCSKTQETADIPGPSPVTEKFRGVRIYILSTGDIHEYSPNLARLASLVKTVRDTASEVYFLLAGDFFMNHHSYDLKRCDGNTVKGVRPDLKVPPDSNHAFDGIAELRVVECLDFNAIVPGNHDWNYGIAMLNRRSVRSVLVGCNIAEPEGLTADFISYRSLTGKYCLNIIGIAATSNLHVKSGETVRVYPLTTSTSLSKIKSAVSSADINVLLTHLTDADDATAFASLKNARGEALFDVLCGGHTHESFAKISAGATYVKAGLYGTYAGISCIWWDTVKKETVRRTTGLVCLENIPADPAVTALIDSLHRVYPHY